MNGDNNTPKHILWISHFIPYPPIGGAFQRSYNLIKSTAENFTITLVALKPKVTSHPLEEQQKAESELGKLCQNVHIVPLPSSRGKLGFISTVAKNLFSPRSLALDFYESREARQKIRDLLQATQYDLVFFDSISVAGYASECGTLPKVLNHHNAESTMLKRRIAKEPNILKKIFFSMETWKLRRDEKSYCSMFHINTVVSELDGKILASESPDAKFAVIENGVDTTFFSQLPVNLQSCNLIFAGRQDQYANRDGIIWFCDDIWPRVKQSQPDLNLQIVGSNPSEYLKKLAANDTSIRLLGYVDDVRKCFADSCICIIPLRDGGGTRLKVLDAMAMGVPIVATNIAREGLEVTPENEILTADTPQEFVHQIERIRGDIELASNLSMKARNTIEEKYSWRTIGVKLNTIFLSLVEKTREADQESK